MSVTGAKDLLYRIDWLSIERLQNAATSRNGRCQTGSAEQQEPTTSLDGYHPTGNKNQPQSRMTATTVRQYRQATRKRERKDDENRILVDAENRMLVVQRSELLGRSAVITVVECVATTVLEAKLESGSESTPCQKILPQMILVHPVTLGKISLKDRTLRIKL